jgi:hypothetical protein
MYLHDFMLIVIRNAEDKKSRSKSKPNSKSRDIATETIEMLKSKRIGTSFYSMNTFDTNLAKRSLFTAN